MAGPRCEPVRRASAGLQYRLTRGGVGLWAAFLAIRVGSFLLAEQLGAHLLENSGAILLSFATNRLVSSTIVRRRIVNLDPSGAPVPASAGIQDHQPASPSGLGALCQASDRNAGS